MKFETALKKLASSIWKSNDSNAIYCIVPSEYSLKNKKNHLDDAIYQKIEATHYKKAWQINGKSVKLIFFKADSFGASYDLGKKVFETVVDVT